MAIDLKPSYQEFVTLKREATTRNMEYYLLRQAVRGNFRWPRDWPTHIPKIKHNLCKPITERFVTYLMGKGFNWNIERPNSLDYRETAEKAEKILTKLFELSDAGLQWEMGAKTGSQLGRTIFKVYKKGPEGSEHACFSYCQPDYFYPIASGDNSVGDYSVVYYSYPMDKLEAKRMFGAQDYKTELEVDREMMYDVPTERQTSDQRTAQERNVPVLEIWTKDDYAFLVGGKVIYNAENPNKWTDTGEGYIPFVTIENIRDTGGAGYAGEADIGQARELNEQLNYTVSRKLHIVSRWLQPTLVWEGAPQNYAEILTSTLGGGGAIPARLGARLYFLAYDRPNPAVQEIEATLRQAILETAGMNELAMQGTIQGSINTGPSLQAQFQPVLSTISKKQTGWEVGLKKLSAMLLQKMEDIGDSKALGKVVVNANQKSQQAPDGEVIELSGTDIDGLRTVSIAWPGVLPKDDTESSQMEMQKAQQGLQSYYTTLEKLGEEYPDDELARLRMENQDPTIKGQAVAEQMRSQAPLIQAQANAAQTYNDIANPPEAASEQAAPPPGEEATGDQSNDLGAMIRDLARNAQPKLDPEQASISASMPEGY